MKNVSELMSLTGRTALITGGGGHIGSAFAHSLAELGASIAVVDINMESAEKVATEISEKHGVRTMPLAVDMAEEKAVCAMPETVAGNLGSLDIIINSAAFVGTSGLEGWVTPFEEQSVDVWRQALEVNLTACFALIQAATPLLRASGHGSVINVASTYGVVGPDMSLYEGTAMGNPAAYAASKGGMIQMTRWLSTVLAPDIRVNAISPGGVWRNQPEKFVKRYETKTPMKRMGTEEDMVGAAVYLASDLSSYVTGQNILVDGGFTAW